MFRKRVKGALTGVAGPRFVVKHTHGNAVIEPAARDSKLYHP